MAAPTAWCWAATTDVSWVWIQAAWRVLSMAVRTVASTVDSSVVWKVGKRDWCLADSKVGSRAGNLAV